MPERGVRASARGVYPDQQGPFRPMRGYSGPYWDLWGLLALIGVGRLVWRGSFNFIGNIGNMWSTVVVEVFRQGGPAYAS